MHTVILDVDADGQVLHDGDIVRRPVAKPGNASNGHEYRIVARKREPKPTRWVLYARREDDRQP